MVRNTATFAHQAVLAVQAFGMEGAALAPVAMGHINATYVATSPSGSLILQRVNPIFAPEVNLDIVAIVAHLRARGINGPVLQKTLSGQFWHTDAQGGTWRLMTLLPGHAIERCTSAAQCHTVGRMLGAFHKALADMQHTFAAPRIGVHDTARHLARLRAALATHQNHLAYAHIAPVAQEILFAAERLPLLQADLGPNRIVHGDPKISNFMFNSAEEATALVDLDTLAHMPVALELGDALRSWCSPGGEDPKAAGFELSHFEAAMEGYREGAETLLRPQEVRCLPLALGTIATELAARFACDALEERYFGWDDSRYSGAWEHNLERAQSQWLLAQSYQAQQGSAARMIERVFGLTL